MPYAQGLYDETYYRCHCGPAPYERTQAWLGFFANVADEVIRSLQPRTVFDAGCAWGFLVEAFWDRGVEARGIDISSYAIKQVRRDVKAFCNVASLADPIEGHYNLVTCIEVLEHMPPEEADRAIHNLTQITDTILFSSSPTDLAEETHFNVRPTISWIKSFAACSFYPDLIYDASFLTSHAILFRRQPEPPTEDTLILYSETIRLRIAKAMAEHAGRVESQLRNELLEAKAMAEQALIECKHLKTTLDIVQYERDAVISSTTWRFSGPARNAFSRLPPPLKLLLRRSVKTIWWLLAPWSIPRRLRWQNERKHAVLLQQTATVSKAPPKDNIIIVVHQASRTGAPILAWNIASFLTRKYNVFTFLLEGGPLCSMFSAVSVQLHGHFEWPRGQASSPELALAALLQDHSFKYAIINSAESRETIRLFKNQRIPTLLLVHEFASLYPPGTLHEAFDLANEIVFPARVVLQSALDAYPRLSHRETRLLPQGMSTSPEGTERRNNLALTTVMSLTRIREQGARIVLGAGSVSLRKGVDLFITAAAAVLREFDAQHIHFVWVGDGYLPDQDKGFSVYLREQLNRTDSRQIFTFVDSVSNLDPLYDLADIFFLSSRLDPLPNVFIDAAVHGIPIVCFKGASGAADILQSTPDTSYGVVDYLDSASAAQKIMHLARDSATRSRVGNATRNLAQTTFNMEKYITQLDELGTAAYRRPESGTGIRTA